MARRSDNAIKKLNNNVPDLTVMSMNYPEKCTGLEALLLRASTRRRHLIIWISG